MTTRNLSELEGVCLGLVYKHQPCTAYRVRQELKAAPSSHWRASAGSVYPLLNRLQDENILSSEPDEKDGRGRIVLRITHNGRAALEKWLLAGTAPELISSVTDPVRSRTFFLGVLRDAKRADYLDRLIIEMERYLRETQDHLDTTSRNNDVDAYVGALGAVRLTEARLGWLREVRDILY